MVQTKLMCPTDHHRANSQPATAVIPQGGDAGCISHVFPTICELFIPIHAGTSQRAINGFSTSFQYVFVLTRRLAGKKCEIVRLPEPRSDDTQLCVGILVAMQRLDQCEFSNLAYRWSISGPSSPAALLRNRQNSCVEIRFE